MALHAEVWGRGMPLLALHGFTGAAGSWAGLASALSGLRLVAVDLPGHGRSPLPPPPPEALPETVRALEALLDRLELERVGVLGYSLGGRLALHLALAAPDRVRALLLESATAGIEDSVERERRAADDRALAADLERDGLAPFVARWGALPLFATQASLPEPVQARQRRLRLDHDPRALAAALRGLGQGACPPVWGHLGQLSMPALVVAGALDPKYSAIARRLADGLARARLAVVEDAGHAVHLERPEVFADLVGGFLNRPGGG